MGASGVTENPRPVLEATIQSAWKPQRQSDLRAHGTTEHRRRRATDTILIHHRWTRIPEAHPCLTRILEWVRGASPTDSGAPAPPLSGTW